MKRIITSLLLAATAIIPALAKGDWKGKILDENGEPMPYVNVVLLNAKDSTIISAATTDMDGTYNIPTTSKEGIIMVAMLGYQTEYVAPQEGQTIALKLDTQVIGSAVVSAVMPKTKLTGEGLQTGIRGSVLENVGTATDVLEKTPGIIKGQNGIEVIGRGNPVIYINGHKVTDSSELDRLLSSEIQSVEVINNPGAQYDATVNCVVRIKTIRRQGDGFSFNAGVRDEQSLQNPPARSSKSDLMPYNDPSANFDMNYRKGSVDIFAGANVYQYSSRQVSDLAQKSIGKVEYSQVGDLLAECQARNYSLNGGMNWQIAQNHSVGFKTEYSESISAETYQVIRDRDYRNGVLFDDITSIGRMHNPDAAPYSVTTNAYYNGTAGKLGIDLNVDYYTSKDGNVAHTDERSEMTGDASVDNSTDSGNRLVASKLVLSYPIWMGQLQAGTEETFTRHHDDYVITGTFVPCSSSKVREDNYAAFATYAFALPKVGQISAGLRYEHVNYSYQDLLGTGSFERNYDNVFPNISYANQFGKVQTMASFSMKTMRPGFEMLSDAVRYNSRYIMQSGNAALQPQTALNASLTTIYKFWVLGANYTKVNDMIATWSYLYNADGVVMVRPRNLEEPFRNLTFYINATPTVGIWNLNYTVGVNKQWLSISAPDPDNANVNRVVKFCDKPMAFAQMNNTISLKHSWQLEAGAEYHSKGYFQNLYMTNHFFNLTAAVQKSFLKDALVVRLEGRDLTRTARYNIHTDFGAYLVDQTNLMDSQRVVLSVRYKFNTAASKYKGTGAGSDTMSRMKK